MRRRDFVLGLSGTASFCTREAYAQQQGRIRRVGVLSPLPPSDDFAKALIAAFMRGLSELGWFEGRNLRMDFRRVAGDVDRVGVYAKELVELQPDVILADSTPQTAALQHETRSIPIVFVLVSDPIGSGFVASLPRPNSNITGFMVWEPTLAGKWLQLLIEPRPFNQADCGNIQSRYRALHHLILCAAHRGGSPSTRCRADPGSGAPR